MDRRTARPVIGNRGHQGDSHLDNNQFKVIFTGQLLPGHEPEAVAEQLAKRFRLPLEKAQRIVHSGKEVVLKQRAEHVKAYGFKSALEEMGMQARLEPAGVLPKKPPPKTDSNTAKVDVASLKEHKKWTLESKPDLQKEAELAREEAQRSEQAGVDSAQRRRDEEAREFKNNRPTAKRALGDSGKQLLAWGGAALGGVLLFGKKLGLFKLLKIGGIAAAATYMGGYDSDAICMGNEMCEETVDDQMDICWKSSGMEAHDWDNMTEAEFYALKPAFERDFIGCFLYENGDRVFLSPIDLRVGLIVLCELTETPNCESQAEPQIRSCHKQSGLSELLDERTADVEAVLWENPEVMDEFFTCFTDANGAPLFVDMYGDE